MENPQKNLEEITRHARALRKHLPEIKSPYEELNAQAYKDGTIPAKNKRLMALCTAVVQGCTGCTLFQTEAAIQLGASVEEITETLAVAVALGGSMASSHAAEAMALLEQKGLI